MAGPTRDRARLALPIFHRLRAFPRYGDPHMTFAPEPSGWSARSIAKLADALRSRFPTRLVPSVDLVRMVEAYGGSVRYVAGSEADEDLRESLIVEPDGSFKIILPLHTPPTRDRFTIAHELGHYFLHWREAVKKGAKPQAQMQFARSGKGFDPKVEAEANTFAACLLMPADPFTTAWGDLAGDVDAVAERFGVSSSAARARAEVLELPAS